MLYWITFIIIALFFNFISADKKLDPNIRKFAQICLILVVVYFSAFRDGLGQDYDGYFDLLMNGYFNEYTLKEPGFSFLSNIVYYTELSPVFFFLIMALMTNYLFINSFNRYNNTFLIIFIYLTGSIFYFNTFNLVRQMGAASIFMYGIRFIENRKLLPYVLCVLLAASFHISAILLLPIYFIVNRAFSNKLLTSVLVISIIVGQILKFNLTSFLGQYFMVYYWYFEDEAIIVGESGYLTLFFNLVLILLIFYKKRSQEIKYKVVFNLFFIGVFLYNLIPSFHYIFRFATYFIVFAPIVLPSLDKTFPKRVWTYILILGFGTMFFITLYSSLDNKKIIPDKLLNLESVFDQ
ncbi:MAG: EpsG family protein [Lutibacter sp.]|nr:EpsG family protein [Lutibacter sp.]